MLLSSLKLDDILSLIDCMIAQVNQVLCMIILLTAQLLLFKAMHKHHLERHLGRTIMRTAPRLAMFRGAITLTNAC